MRLFALILGSLVLFIDQVSKFLTFRYLPLMDYFHYVYPYGGIPVIKDFFGIEFSIGHATNTGAAWGILEDHAKLLVVLRILLIVSLILYVIYYHRERSWLPIFALIIAGALGNVIDFFVYGHVIDMFHVVLWGYDFPVFNVADASISIGVVLLFLLSLFTPSHEA